GQVVLRLIARPEEQLRNPAYAPTTGSVDAPQLGTAREHVDPAGIVGGDGQTDSDFPWIVDPVEADLVERALHTVSRDVHSRIAEASVVDQPNEQAPCGSPKH